MILPVLFVSAAVTLLALIRLLKVWRVCVTAAMALICVPMTTTAGALTVSSASVAPPAVTIVLTSMSVCVAYDVPVPLRLSRNGMATNTPKAGTAIESMWAQAPNDGFLAGWSKAEVLKPGTVIDRYGLETGRFLSPAGTALEARALPVGAELKGLRTYEVLKPLPVRAGVAAPAFGQPGLGIQYMTGMPVADLIKQGFVKAVGG